MINGAYMHLLINHVSLIAIPVSLVFLIFLKTNEAKRVALVILTLSCLATIPIYLTGDPAEHVLKLWHVADLHNKVEPHEDAAEVALILSILTAVAAAAGVWKSGDKRIERVSMLMAFVTTVSLGVTAFYGGFIRHPEAHQPPPPQQISAPADSATTPTPSSSEGGVSK